MNLRSLESLILFSFTNDTTNIKELRNTDLNVQFFGFHGMFEKKVIDKRIIYSNQNTDKFK